MKSAVSKIMFAVLKLSVSLPFMRVIVLACSILRLLTIHGPMGLKLLQFFAQALARPLCCLVRSLTSLLMIQPKTQSSALSQETNLAIITEHGDQAVKGCSAHA
ncbi:hypothetical protein OAJ57_01340 [Alphaproteobacteria bacterium]|nr:hypothetical protein [Alphaproteobacteria bacterium]